MQDEMIVDLYWKRDESAISETERKYGRFDKDDRRRNGFLRCT